MANLDMFNTYNLLNFTNHSKWCTFNRGLKPAGKLYQSCFEGVCAKYDKILCKFSITPSILNQFEQNFVRKWATAISIAQVTESHAVFTLSSIM